MTKKELDEAIEHFIPSFAEPRAKRAVHIVPRLNAAAVEAFLQDNQSTNADTLRKALTDLQIHGRLIFDD